MEIKFTYKNAAKSVAKNKIKINKANNRNKNYSKQRSCKLYAAKLVCMWITEDLQKQYFCEGCPSLMDFQTLSLSKPLVI